MNPLIIAAALVVPFNNPSLDDKIEGKWVCVKAEHDGEESKEPLGSTMTFSEGKLTIHDKNKGTDEKGSYKVDSSKKPSQITLIPDDPDKAGAKEFVGIFEVKDDKLTLCISGPGGERPTELTTKPDSKRFLMVFDREKSGR